MAESEAQDQFVSEDSDTATDPPAVLNVNLNPPSPPSSRSTAESTSTTREEMDKDTPSTTPATIPGLNEMINEWQISGIPEEEQFFSTNVCL